MQHSQFSPSKAHRWLLCPKSIILEQGLPDSTSIYATEGTLAHKVCENLILNKGKLTLTDNIPSDMLDYCIGYYEYFKALNPVKYWVETKVNLTSVIPNTYGYCDLIVIDNLNNLHIIDFKYGAGVSVSAIENKQLMMYALGVVDKLKPKDSSTVSLCVYQPRIDNISVFDIKVGVLKGELQNYRIAYNDANSSNPTIKAGISQCKFCKVKTKCPALFNLLKEVKEIMNKELMSKEDVLFVLDNAKLINEFISNIEIKALKDAINGEQFTGYKLVEGRSNRCYNPDAEQVMITTLGVDKCYTKKLIGITEASKLLPKETMNAITFKPQGKPTLVKDNDKRPTLLKLEDEFTNLG